MTPNPLTIAKLAGFLIVVICANFSQAYPIDGYEYTGIKRLDFYNLAQQGVVSGRQLPSGGKQMLDTILPRGANVSVETLSNDKKYHSAMLDFLGADKENYGVALLDLSDPDNPLFAGHNLDYRSNVGSIGKILVGIALFQELAKRHPEDIEARESMLRNTQIVADKFIETDHHKVPLWDVDNRKLEHRALRIGDTASLWEYLDWMLSASSNAAASMVMREVLLMRHFAGDYPVASDVAQDYLTTAGATALRESMLGALRDAVVTNGLDEKNFRQGIFFTRYGKDQVGGVSSYGTPQELLKLLVRIEQGKLIDTFSSREMKRLLYMTQRRIRYASHPALNDYGVYFKSGSLYSCKPEEGFTCEKYKGNKRNSLASVAIVEAPFPETGTHYLVVVISNVLRVNSAVAHQTLALRIHRMIEARHHEPTVPEQISEQN